jgi:hypothetical protein
MNEESAIYAVENQCQTCARRTGTYTCTAFPGDVIPPLILFGVWDHTITYDRDGQSDGGLTYVPKEEEDVQSIAPNLGDIIRANP